MSPSRTRGGASGADVQQLSLPIETEPTKELFIAMLTRDVGLTPAIVDLADNCIDGARRIQADESWEGFWIEIHTRNGLFKIEDNCGGIEVETAQKYAFRFGRPEDAELVEGSVGRFGVGMKRGLFKMGRHFSIVSTTSSSQFEVVVDVDKWAKEPKWPFYFAKEPIHRRFAEDKRGTLITVTRLHESVAQQFQLESFERELQKELASRLETAMGLGVVIKVNGVQLKPRIRELVTHPKLRPAHVKRTLKNPGGGPVSVELYCGVGRPQSRSTSNAEAGWYVFCNGRMLLEADKSAATGWNVDEPESLPIFHGQFKGFRGFAYLEAKDPGDLPWNTTKTALDPDHPVYRAVRAEMVALGRPVINFFNKIKNEQDELRTRGVTRQGPLETLLEEAKETTLLDELPLKHSFQAPDLKPAKPKKSSQPVQLISFSPPLARAKRVREASGAKSWREVGERIFDYYYKNECEDE